MPDYKLSAQLKGHDADVRAVSFPKSNVVLSSSRDSTVRLWNKTAEKPPTFDNTIASQGNGYVNSVTFIPPSSDRPEGLIASAGAETIIEVKRPSLTSADNADRLLVGHSHNVCTLDATPSGKYLVSGSWDGKAIVWDTDKWDRWADLVHEGEVRSVWAVLAYDENIVITGSADKHIRIFDLRRVSGSQEVEPIRTLTTSDVVRALVKLPSGIKGHPSGADFASAGNDGIISLWKLGGKQVGSLQGHDSFIYSLACSPTAEIISAGEDRTVRVWRGSECIQTITHPAISVWTVAVCRENGDIVTGASDNMVRVFSRSPERIAAPETLSQFEESVRSSAIPQQQLGQSLNKEKMDPHSWLLTNTGTKEGQIKTVLEENNTIGAYQWSSGEQRWVHVGTVVDSTGSSGRKVEFKGKEWDYVFDVDIEEGKPPLKLPYNLSENPYEAATRFLGDNELSISYIDQVAQFITTNTQGATIGQSSEAPTTDASGADFSSTEPATGTTYLPYTEYLSLTQAKSEPVLKKLNSLNEKHILAGNKHTAMNPTGLACIEQVLQATMGTPKQKAKAPPGLGEGAHIALGIVAQWPYGDRLPALDALRCLVAWPGVASVTHPQHGDIINVALRGALDVEQPISNTSTLAEFADTLDAAQVSPNNVMMALRAVTNLFVTEEGRKLVAENISSIIAILARIAGLKEGQVPIGAENNNVQIALTSALFNFASLGFNERGKLDIQALSGVCEIAAAVIARQSDPEVLFRAVMALGMILATGGQARQIAKALDVGGPVTEAAKKSGEPRMKDLARECMAFLKS
ncbi:PUL domain-containing protein [Podospora australis]|uniref:PUL domain-containing protein n=1 Tax=Podospora australis TaxID=1536484 RepID=A0AAN7AHB2_9PEZI|nr:PUL domain-containing protein [Podospora australis]